MNSFCVKLCASLFITLIWFENFEVGLEHYFHTKFTFYEISKLGWRYPSPNLSRDFLTDISIGLVK